MMKIVSRPRTSNLRITARLAVVALASLAAACGDDSTAPGGPIVRLEAFVYPHGTPTTNLLRGITVQLMGVPVNRNEDWVNIPVTWSSSDNARATVDANGLVTTVAGGDVVITATAGGQSDTVQLNIRYPVGTVTVGAPAASIRQEGTVALPLTILGTDGTAAVGRTVAWSSSNTAVATVNSSGVVTGVADGTATITATSEGVSGSTTVTVLGAPLVATVTVTPGSPFKGIGQTQQMAHTSRAASGTTIAGTTATWSSSSTSIATVTATGLVTCLATGTSSITATVDNGIGTNVTGSTAMTCAPLLVSGVARTADPTTVATATYYAIEVPAGAASWSITTTGGTGDADIYVFAPGVVPSAINTSTSALAFSNSTAFSALSGNDETVSRATPAAGTWRIAVFAWGGAGDVNNLSMTATITP